MNTYSGKTVLITGSRGIGEALVKNLFAKGANVIVVSPSPSSETLVATLLTSSSNATTGDGATNNKIVAIRCDLSSASSASELAAKAVQASKDFGTHGTIHHLILCAAIAPFVDLGRIEEDEWNRVLAVNITGPVFLVKALTPSIANDGSIIIFSTSGTFSSGVLPVYLPYMASKGAINQVARMLAKEPLLVSRGISTTVISPGTIATDMLLGQKTEAELAAYRAISPYGRLGEPDDITKVVDAVISGGKWLNGANIPVNGGMAV
ncbi:hypothetical protein M408DRAFT_28053 [Serendipita vermifera MAFF 305830]|uniref:Ketoreductase domain-containing protein n=1 Tax=Serendipita vermifera MAFF 305830 TaxID=933852 RepID=A0A0C2X180_SERVB|nr:hypothetical protein M408DRAFT_28053 [Serendipita vermifera MAFF 305830]